MIIIQGNQTLNKPKENKRTGSRLAQLDTSTKDYLGLDKENALYGQRIDFSELLMRTQTLPEKGKTGHLLEKHTYVRAREDSTNKTQKVYTHETYVNPTWTLSEHHEPKLYMYVGTTTAKDWFNRKLAFVQVYPIARDVSDGLYLLPNKIYMSENMVFREINDDTMETVENRKRLLDKYYRKYL